jgi:hypothetical protein
MLGDLTLCGLRGGDAEANMPPDPPVPLDEQEVAAFEKLIGEKLPEAYRRFLLQTGGVGFGGCVRPIEPREYYGETEGVDILYGGKGDEPYDIWSNYDPSDDWRPSGTITIAENLYGDRFYLAITGPRRGEVFFVPQDEHRICLTAESFTDFLNRIEREH